MSIHNLEKMFEPAAVAASATVMVKPAVVGAPQHLVISSYPSNYEIKTITRGGVEVLLRPIKPEGALLLVGLFHSRSPTSVYFPFFSAMNDLNHPSEMAPEGNWIFVGNCDVILRIGNLRPP
jgi:hypothetical protein